MDAVLPHPDRESDSTSLRKRGDGKKKGRDRSRPFVFASLVMCEAYFASARFGGVAGHDFTSVS